MSQQHQRGINGISHSGNNSNGSNSNSSSNHAPSLHSVLVNLGWMTVVIFLVWERQSAGIISHQQSRNSAPSMRARLSLAPHDHHEEVERGTGSATSGQLFKGQHYHFLGERFFEGELPDVRKINPVSNNNKQLDTADLHCEKWAVVTTIFEPTAAVNKMAALVDRCLVIVGDKKSPKTYPLTSNLNNSIYLDVEKQMEFAKQFPISDRLPWNHFGRKNVGFLYAIWHGAKEIFDFDDDNEIMGDVHYLNAADTSTATVLRCNEAVNYTATPFNPYSPLMNAPVDETGQCEKYHATWPRGFPLDRIKELSNPFGTSMQLKEVDVRLESIGVIQFLANHDPDVDAIYRLTQPIPFDFPSDKMPVLVPKESYAPYNAQATLHKYSALWSMYLPVTVHGRVSDIWRGYAAQRIFLDTDVRLVFMPPLVAQFRNAHNYLADFNSEEPLYDRSDMLLQDLSEWRCSAPTLPGHIESLWIMLYERGYIQELDVKLMQEWLKALTAIDYKWPSIAHPKTHRYR